MISLDNTNFNSKSPINTLQNEQQKRVVSPQDVEIDFIQDDLIKRGDHLSAKSDKDAYKAHINSQVDGLRAKILALQNKGIPVERLSKEIKSAQESLNSSANSFLAACQSYQRANATQNFQRQKVADQNKSDEPSFSRIIPEIGPVGGVIAGALFKEAVLAPMLSKTQANISKELNIAKERELKAMKELAQLTEEYEQAQKNFPKARSQAIRAGSIPSQGNVIPLSKVRASVNTQDEIVAKILSKTAIAKGDLTAARAGLDIATRSAAGQAVVRKLVKTGVVEVGGMLAGTITAACLESGLLGKAALTAIGTTVVTAGRVTGSTAALAAQAILYSPDAY
jgi:hypothetical protein